MAKNVFGKLVTLGAIAGAAAAGAYYYMNQRDKALADDFDDDFDDFDDFDLDDAPESTRKYVNLSSDDAEEDDAEEEEEPHKKKVREEEDYRFEDEPVKTSAEDTVKTPVEESVKIPVEAPVKEPEPARVSSSASSLDELARKMREDAAHAEQEAERFAQKHDDGSEEFFNDMDL